MHYWWNKSKFYGKISTKFFQYYPWSQNLSFTIERDTCKCLCSLYWHISSLRVQMLLCWCNITMLLMSVLSLPPTASPQIADIQWCPDIKLIKCSDWAEYTTSIRPYNTQILIITRISTTKLIFRNIDIDQVFHI